MEHSCKVISSSGELQVLFLKDFFSEEQVEVLRNNVWSEDMLKVSSETHSKRGHFLSLNIGLQKRRGGDNSINFSSSLQLPFVRKFVDSNEAVWEAIAQLMQCVTKEYAQKAKQRSKTYKFLFGEIFCFAVINVTSAYGLHRDNKDNKWSCLIPLGNFSGGLVRFPYLGLQLQTKEQDLVLLNSYNLYHEISEVTSGRRSSIVVTTHYAVLTGHARK